MHENKPEKPCDRYGVFPYHTFMNPALACAEGATEISPGKRSTK
jgi:hypothetical protein